MDDKLVLARRAIDAFFSDTSISVLQTRDGLEELRDLIDELLESLPDGAEFDEDDDDEEWGDEEDDE